MRFDESLLLLLLLLLLWVFVVAFGRCTDVIWFMRASVPLQIVLQSGHLCSKADDSEAICGFNDGIAVCVVAWFGRLVSIKADNGFTVTLELNPFCLRWVIKCFFNVLISRNGRLHSGQLNGFSPLTNIRRRRRSKWIKEKMRTNGTNDLDLTWLKRTQKQKQKQRQPTCVNHYVSLKIATASKRSIAIFTCKRFFIIRIESWYNFIHRFWVSFGCHRCRCCFCCCCSCYTYCIARTTFRWMSTHCWIPSAHQTFYRCAIIRMDLFMLSQITLLAESSLTNLAWEWLLPRMNWIWNMMTKTVRRTIYVTMWLLTYAQKWSNKTNGNLLMWCRFKLYELDSTLLQISHVYSFCSPDDEFVSEGSCVRLLLVSKSPPLLSLPLPSSSSSSINITSSLSSASGNDFNWELSNQIACGSLWFDSTW